jgi:hypothetical protein
VTVESWIIDEAVADRRAFVASAPAFLVHALDQAGGEWAENLAADGVPLTADVAETIIVAMRALGSRVDYFYEEGALDGSCAQVARDLICETMLVMAGLSCGSSARC